jgi:hypothetical protein
MRIQLHIKISYKTDTNKTTQLAELFVITKHIKFTENKIFYLHLSN